VHHTIDDTEMATIRRSGSGWQVLIRRKNYVGPRSKTFLSRDLAQSWADAVEEMTKKVFPNIPITLGEAINDYINGPLLLHRSAENEKYPLRVTAESWLGDIPLKDLQIKHFAVWRDERLLKVKPNTVMRELRLLRVLIDWARDERGAEIKDNPARHLRVRGTGDARAPFFTDQDEKKLLYELSLMSNKNHLRLIKLALATGFRRSELLSLTWRNIDLKKRIVYIYRKNCAATDNSSAPRLIPLPFYFFINLISLLFNTVKLIRDFFIAYAFPSLTTVSFVSSVLIPNLPFIKLAIKIRTGTWDRPPITILVSE